MNRIQSHIAVTGSTSISQLHFIKMPQSVFPCLALSVWSCIPWRRLTCSFNVTLEREVKRATRDLTNLLTGIETPLSRLEAVQNKYTELLGRMKRLDQENAKNKKRGDLFQKEKETQRSELTKTVSMKEKLEKLCRELTKENKKVKVRHTHPIYRQALVIYCCLSRFLPNDRSSLTCIFHYLGREQKN